MQIPFQTRVFFDARLEPKSTVYHGAGQDPEGFDDYRSALGKRFSPALYMTYASILASPQHMTDWGKGLKKQLEAIGNKSVMPQIGLSMTEGKDTGLGRDAEVAKGLHDESIESFCRALSNVGRPVYIRIGYEFEGRWNGYRPGTYKKSFIRIVRALRRHQVPAATVWCSAGPSAANVSMDGVMEYYPGDEWVDWWGIDIFSRQDINSAKTIAFCDYAAEHRKPVMIGESSARYVGVLEGKACWDKWFAPYFALIRARPEIKSFCYINWEWGHWADKYGFNWHDWGDCRIERNEYVLDRYRQEMDLPLYEHAVRTVKGEQP